MNLYSTALECCPGALNNVTYSKTLKQYNKNNTTVTTVQELVSRECSFEQDGLKWFWKKITDVCKDCNVV